MNKYIIVGLLSVVFSCVSQVILKKSAGKQWGGYLREYLNLYVISAYAITALCMFLTIFMYKGVDYKYGAIIESVSYLIIMIFGRFFFDEKITRNKIIGNALIIAGIIIFNL